MQNLVAAFLNEPTHDALRELLLNGTGETSRCDFKEEMPKRGILAKHLLAMANSGGGCLVLGVREQSNQDIELIGISKAWDNADIQRSIDKFVPHVLKEIVHTPIFTFPPPTNEHADDLSGKQFQVLLVTDDPMHAPYVSTGESGEDIKAGVVYVRRGAMSV